MEKDDDALDYSYYYCVLVPDSVESIPKDMIKKVIPQATYAVFHLDVTENTLNGLKLDCNVYDYIDGIWLPESGFVLSDTPDYEVINRDKQHIDYYISINA